MLGIRLGIRLGTCDVGFGCGFSRLWENAKRKYSILEYFNNDGIEIKGVY